MDLSTKKGWTYFSISLFILGVFFFFLRSSPVNINNVTEYILYSFQWGLILFGITCLVFRLFFSKFIGKR